MKIFERLILFAFLMSSAGVLLAQTPPPPPATPIDGGLGLLLAGGAVYGIKKIRDARKNS